MGIFRLKLKLPLLHLIQEAVEVFTKLVKFFDTPIFHPSGEITICADVMHHIGDVLQGSDHAVMQRVGNGDRDDGGKKNTAGKNGKRHPDEVANQAVTRGKANFADHRTVMHDWLCNRYREKPAADQCAQRVVIIIRIPRPVCKTLFVYVNNFCYGKLPLLTQGCEGFVGGQRIVENQRGFKTVAHGGAG